MKPIHVTRARVAFEIVASLFLATLFWEMQSLSADEPLGFFIQSGELRFDTGLLRGKLGDANRSVGLVSVQAAPTGEILSGPYGWLSVYRLLDAQVRYGPAAWDWASTRRVLDHGAAEIVWSADPEHPFDLKAVYRWQAPGIIDLQTTVTARRPLRSFEVFVATYFAGFDKSMVYAKTPSGQARFIEATEDRGRWQAFPGDEVAAQLIQDGRWLRPPSPVTWAIHELMAAPLALRVDEPSGRTAVLMASPKTCFAVYTPHSGESHRSLYVSLFGQDFPAGQSAIGHVRLVVGRGLTSDDAIRLYEEFRNHLDQR